MTSRLILKKDLEALRLSLERARVAFHAPQRRDGAVNFHETGPQTDARHAASSAVVFDYRNTALPPKRFFRPACQTTGVIARDELSAAPAAFPAAVLFGVRPCDAASFTLLDRVFLQGEYTDNFYQARREATTVVALACDAVGAACFCRELGSSPTAHSGADVLAFDLGSKLLWEAHSPKGEALLAEHAACFTDPENADLADKEKRYAAADGAAAGAALSGKDQLLAAFHSPAWEAVSATCLGCHVCAYFCPTCHCFSLADELRGQRGRRRRVEDSCLNRNFTAEASGHNPRPTARERMRQRIMHKFVYAEDLYGSTLCVGCGRCVEHCPVNIDIRETLSRVCQ